MQYMGLWLQVRFEDSIFSWKTSTHFFWVLSFALLLPSICKEERKQQQRSSYRSFIWSETPMKNSFVFHWISEECVCWIIHFELTIDFVYIHININDVFFFQILHMIMRPLIVTKKMAKESATTMSPSTSAGTKLRGFSFENSKIREL